MLSDRFRTAVEERIVGRSPELFREDATFRSPVVFKPYEGRAAMLVILGAVLQLFDDFHYTDQVETGDVAALAFSTRVGDREVNGIDFLHFDADGRVRELAVYIRPMSALSTLAEEMKRKLEEAGAI
jgi:hypothetical protein